MAFLKSQPGRAISVKFSVSGHIRFPIGTSFFFISLDIFVTGCKQCKKTILIDGHWQHDHTKFSVTMVSMLLLSYYCDNWRVALKAAMSWTKQCIKFWGVLIFAQFMCLNISISFRWRMHFLRLIKWVWKPIHTHTNNWGRLKWPSVITRLTAQFMCVLMCAVVMYQHRKEYGHTWHWMSLFTEVFSNNAKVLQSFKHIKTKCINICEQIAEDISH